VAHHGDQELPSAGPRIPPRRLSEVNIEYRAASRRRTARIIGSAILALAVGLVVLAAVGRGAVLAMWPESASVYRAFNLTPSPQAGLKVRLTVTRTNSGVVVAGDIVNSADSEREVPQLRVSLQDTRRNDVDIKTIDPPVARLAAGATARFETVFEHPSMLATGAAAIFAPDR
jgi:hypothetical protein